MREKFIDEVNKDGIKELIKILCHILNNYSNESMEISNVDDTFLMAKRHNVSLLVYKYLAFYHKELISRLSIDITKELMSNELRILLTKNTICKISQTLTNKNINHVVLKGFSVSQYYPYTNSREQKDMDIYVIPDEFERAATALVDLGFERIRRRYHDIFFNKSGLMVELHHQLVDYEYIDLPLSLDQILFESKTNLKINEVDIPILNRNMNYIHNFVHLLVHVSYFGASIKNVFDLVLIYRSLDRYEIQLIEKTLGEFNLLSAHYSLLGLFELIFSIKQEDDIIKAKVEQNIQNAELLYETIISSRADGIVDNIEKIGRYEYIKFKKSSWLKKLQHYLIPDENTLSDRYSYAKKSKLLLPVAWIHRFIHSLLRSDLSISQKLTYYSNLKRRIKRREAMETTFRLKPNVVNSDIDEDEIDIV